MKFFTQTKKTALSALAVLSLVVVGCGGGGGGGNSDPYYHAWYDVYGNYCGTGYPAPGCNFYWDGSKILDFEDPYYTTANYNLLYALWEYTDSYGLPALYLGYAWLSVNNILYDEYGNALNESSEETGKDIIESAAQAAEAKILEAGKGFAEKYVLQEEQGVEVARSLNGWAELVKDRKERVRTAKDITDFSKRLFNIDPNSKAAQSALGAAKSGDLTQAHELNKQVADKWGTSPETSEEILKSWFKDVL
ncbi:MAG: hypothetical protein AB7P04_03075 [Bacteriovoracia bacterium]